MATLTMTRPRSIPLTAKTLKVSTVLDPLPLLTIPVPPGTERVRIMLAVASYKFEVLLNPKSFRRAVRTIEENGAENVAVILQGRLGAGYVIEDAGIATNVKGAKKD